MELNPELKVGNKHPRLWVERLGIYSVPKPEELIREITLRRGVNVIWAKEPEPASQTDDAHIVGHGVGKTSFCLLLRYCLGDTGTLVTNLLGDLKSPFKYGGVGAVIYLDDKPYTVFRHFGEFDDFYAETDSINTLLLAGEGLPYTEFESMLEQRMLSNLSARKIPETEQDIEWSHLLAWLTRDQGARFASFFKWRSGEGTGLKRPALDPPIVMRAVLGLLEAQEQALITSIQREKEVIQKEHHRLAQKEKEAEQIRQRIESDLRQWLGADDGRTLQSTDLFQPGVFQLLDENNTPYAKKLETSERELKAFEDSLQPLRTKLHRAQQAFTYWSKEVELIQARRTGDEKKVRRLQEERDKLVYLAGNCDTANIPYKQCTHLQEKLATISLNDQREAGALRNNISRWVDYENKALDLRDQARQAMRSAEAELSACASDLRGLKIKRDTALIAAQRGQYLRGELERWQNAYGSPEADQAMKKASDALKMQETNVRAQESQLEVMRNMRSERVSQLSKLTDTVARHLIKDIVGTFDPHFENYPFRLLVGSGEAHNVMNVLMGDLVCLLDATYGNAGFPAFLVHDCPREADMSESLYQRYLKVFYELDIASGDADPAFQYIVTTTSVPPPELQKSPYLRLELSSETENELLFKRHLSLQKELQWAE